MLNQRIVPLAYLINIEAKVTFCRATGKQAGASLQPAKRATRSTAAAEQSRCWNWGH